VKSAAFAHRWRSLAATLLSLALGLGLGLGVLAPYGGLEADSPRTTSSRRPRRPATRARARRAPPRPRVTAAQRRPIRRWHARASRDVVRRWQAQQPPPLILRPLVGTEHFELVPDAEGRFLDADALSRAELAFAYRIDGTHAPIHPRLLELVYRAARHFRAPYVHIVSGYRSGNPSSRHGQGRAIDLVLPGVTDRRLAAYLRPQGFVGVGIYPTSGFVHLDVRSRSYFWADASGPSQRNRERRIMRTLGPRFDRIARALGAEPVADVEDTREEEADESTTGELEVAGSAVAEVSAEAETPAAPATDEGLTAPGEASDGAGEAAYAAPP